MDIPALSTSLSQASLAQNVGIRVMSIAKDQAEVQQQNLLKLMDASDPNRGRNLDIRV